MAGMSYDIVSRVIKCLPFKDQYNLITRVIPAEYTTDYAEDFVYMSEVLSRIKDDLPKCLVSKKAVWFDDYVPLEQTFDIKFDTPVYSLPSLTGGFDHNTKSLHKLDVWKDLYQQGHVGPYSINITNKLQLSLRALKYL